MRHIHTMCVPFRSSMACVCAVCVYVSKVLFLFVWLLNAYTLRARCELWILSAILFTCFFRLSRVDGFFLLSTGAGAASFIAETSACKQHYSRTWV